MTTSKLSFKKKLQKEHHQMCSGDRPYIDFLINKVPLSELLGGVTGSIGKFGWGVNTEFELSEFSEFKKAKGSRHENKLYSIYVCAECGKERCGAVMMDIEVLPETIKWKNFVWSDGEEIEAGNSIQIEPLIFEKIEYERAMQILEQMIIK